VKLAIAAKQHAERTNDTNTRSIDGAGQILLPGGKVHLSGPVFSLHLETIRLLAYVNFWIMVRST
jgi:hypothetical protein